MKRKALERFNWERTVDATERLHAAEFWSDGISPHKLRLNLIMPKTYAKTLEYITSAKS